MAQFTPVSPLLRRHASVLFRQGRWTVSELALVLAVSRSTVIRWMREDGLDLTRQRARDLVQARELALAIVEGRAPPPGGPSRRAQRYDLAHAEAVTDPHHMASIRARLRAVRRRPPPEA